MFTGLLLKESRSLDSTLDEIQLPWRVPRGSLGPSSTQCVVYSAPITVPSSDLEWRRASKAIEIDQVSKVP
jgi:hypothetical protein